MWSYYDRHIMTIWLCSSHYGNRAMLITNEEAMFNTLRWQRYINHIATIINLHHIVMTGLYLSNCDYMDMFVTLWCYYVCENRTLLWLYHCENMVIFVTLWWWGYAHRKWGGNAHHIVMTRLYSPYCNSNKCLLHCDDKATFVTLRQ